jgi:hypothetical protein
MFMRRPRDRGEIYDTRTALRAADAFRNLSEGFLREIGPVKDTAAIRAANNIGGLIASATNLALALELYLKALRIAMFLPVPATHELWSLYKKLPRGIKERIQTRYDLLNQTAGDEVSSFNLAMWVGSTPPPGPPPRPPNNSEVDRSLKSVLLRSSNAFETWRYLHEVRTQEEFIFYSFEFYRLGLICDIVRAYTIELLQQAQG